MAIQITPAQPGIPSTTAIQDPAARQFANAVADILRTAQSPGGAVQQLARAASALSGGGGGSVPPSIAQWLFSSELYGKLTRAIDKVDVAAQQAVVAEAVARADAIAAEALARAAGLQDEADARLAALLAEAQDRADAIAVAKTALQVEIDAINATLADIQQTPDYDAGTAYAIGALVKYAGGLYRAIAETTGNLPTDPAYWKKIGDYASLGDAVAAHAVLLNDHATRITAAEGGLAAEVTARETLAAAVAGNTAAITTNETARVAADAALASQQTALTAALDATQAELGARITAAETASIDGDSALASSLASLTATVDTDRANTTALIAAISDVSSDEWNAAASEMAAIRAELEWQATTDEILQAGAAALQQSGDLHQQLKAEAAITSEASARVSAIEAVTEQIDAAVSRLGAAEAASVAEQTTRATDDAALMQAINTAWAITGASQAVKQEGGNLVTNWTAAQADKWSQLEAEVFGAGGQTIRAALAEEATLRANADGNLYGQWTVKLDINGYVAGVGLASESSTAGASTSAFVIRADKFAMVMPGYGEHVPFAIGPSGATFTGLTEWANVTGSGKPADGATVGAPAGTFVNGIAVETLTTAVANFNAANDRNGAEITKPTLLTNGTAIDHTLRADGSVDISFEWAWAGVHGDIDGFLVYVRQSSSAASYTFGLAPAEEVVYVVPANRRAFILFGVAADQYYSFGVEAYRAVDKDINPTGIIRSWLVKATGTGENPYRPSDSVAFSGNVTGTVNGIAAGDINVWESISGTGKPADNATVGATFGVNIGGQITASNVTTYIANAAIGAAQIGSIALVGTSNFSVKSGTSGARMEMDSRAIKVFDSAGRLRVQIGNLDV